MAFWIHLARHKQPDRIAIEGPERSLTYAEVAEAAIGVAGRLRRMGVRGGDRVALALPAVEDFVVALHGCCLAGAVAVPVDLRLTEEERAARLAGAEAVLTELPSPATLSWRMAAFDDAPVTVMHTSGTTAAPKQVVLTHGNWLANALGSGVALGLDPAERWLCPMPLTHVGGLSIPIRSSIYATTAVVDGRFDTERVLNELMDPARRITLVSLVPTMLSRLLDAGLERPPTLRWVLLGGGPIPGALLERAAAVGVAVAPSYGMTETCSQIVTFGWPLPRAEVWTSDGEVVVRGPMVAASALDPDGRLFTGDLGTFDDRGRLVITGRKADTIVTGGENVAPVEVEDVLLTHPGVADAAVFARADAEWGEAVVASVVLYEGATVGPDELRTFCAQRLAGFKVPKAFEFVPAVPRSQTGKLLRRELA
ncbi:MAG TPA: AMP-binding protein [Solirubrobacteraceae bacterium]|nr:AMP-binding protein [Solirubrobacteraceae bacterium]